MALATTTVAGEIVLAGDLTGNGNFPVLINTGVTAGTYTFPTISVDSKGRITSIASTTLNLPIATTTTAGTIIVGENLNVTPTGVLSVPRATNTTRGVVRSGNPDYIAITNGEINVGPKVLVSDRLNVMERNLRYNIVTLTGPSVALNGNQGNYFDLLLTANTTITGVSNLGPGKYYIRVRQDGTGGRALTLPAAFVFQPSANTIVGTAANQVSMIEAVSDGTSLFCESIRIY